MDCGPAALYALAAGFGLGVSYPRLREACQTDVDGTSINALERVARDLGLDAVQMLAPADHVGHARAATLPAIAVTRLPGGSVHFVLVWRRVGRWLQVMDPASGRRWIEVEEFRRSLYIHGVDLPADVWRRFAGSDSAVGVLTESLKSLGHRRARERVQGALQDPGWRSIAALEAAARLARTFVEAGALERGAAAERLVDALHERASTEDPARHAAIPAVCWSVRPHPRAADGAQVLHVRGALLVRARGLVADDAPRGTQAPAPRTARKALFEPPLRVGRELLRELGGRERGAAVRLGLLACAASGLVLLQALVFRASLEIAGSLRLEHERLAAAVLLLGFVAALATIELPLTSGFLRLGRQLEARLRIAFQHRLPRLPGRWFGSRPSSDMAERAHGLFVLRQLPALGGRLVRTLCTLLATAAGLVWLDPGSAPLVGSAAILVLLLPLLFQRALAERELLVRSHHGALSRFYLEALLGLVAVRVHGAARALRGEHEALLVEWARAGLKLARGALALRALTSLCGAAIAIALLGEHLARNGTRPEALLFGYWALALPLLGEQLAQVVLQAPAMRNAARRALEPLAAAPDETPRARAAAAAEAAAEPLAVPGLVLSAAGAAGTLPAQAPAPADATPAPRGVALAFQSVDLTLGGHPVLRGIDFDVAPGEHVALVGRSGAGKSSLISLCLGLARPSAGALRADGRTLTPEAWSDLRRATAWVDPAVQIWNQSAFENLNYGLEATDEASLARVLEEAHLAGLAGTLPGGLAARLGEGGGFLSGGEGQRVRLARALLRPGVRLALLDEPFRGLDRTLRAELLARVRVRWRGATLIAATHDLADTRDFDRVIVLDGGRVVEDGVPAELAARADSRYARLLAAERDLARTGWQARDWKRWRVADGRLTESPGGPA